MTDRYAVIGNPIEQSKSPLIHTAFAQVTGQDIEYTKVLGLLGEFAKTVDAFRAAGGKGMNVTAPAICALLPFVAEQPAELVIVNRTVAKAEQLAALASQHSGGAVPVRGVGYDQLQGQQFDVVFNATSASLTADLPPLPASVFASGALAYELAYGKGLTPFLKLAQQTGVTRLADGVGMLAEQAAEAFAWWRGVRPDTQGVIRQLTVPLV